MCLFHEARSEFLNTQFPTAFVAADFEPRASLMDMFFCRLAVVEFQGIDRNENAIRPWKRHSVHSDCVPDSVLSVTLDYS